MTLPWTWASSIRFLCNKNVLFWIFIELPFSNSQQGWFNGEFLGTPTIQTDLLHSRGLILFLSSFAEKEGINSRHSCYFDPYPWSYDKVALHVKANVCILQTPLNMIKTHHQCPLQKDFVKTSPGSFRLGKSEDSGIRNHHSSASALAKNSTGRETTAADFAPFN